MPVRLLYFLPFFRKCHSGHFNYHLVLLALLLLLSIWQNLALFLALFSNKVGTSAYWLQMPLQWHWCKKEAVLRTDGIFAKDIFSFLDLVVVKGRGAVSDCREHLARPERRLHPWMVSNAILALNFEAVYWHISLSISSQLLSDPTIHFKIFCHLDTLTNFLWQ